MFKAYSTVNGLDLFMFAKKYIMAFYDRIFLGYYCMVKSLLPKENNPETYAVGIQSGAICFLYFAVTLYFLKRSATTLETIGVFFVIFAVHYFLFVSNGKFKKLEKEIECSERLAYRSLLFFITMLAILVYVSTVMSGG